MLVKITIVEDETWSEIEEKMVPSLVTEGRIGSIQIYYDSKSGTVEAAKNAAIEFMMVNGIGDFVILHRKEVKKWEENIIYDSENFSVSND